jgi:hypothetical protein
VGLSKILYKLLRLGIAAICSLTLCGPALAETAFVKYRGPVQLKTFQCERVSRSSFIERVCYDSREHYMVINLCGTYYHSCEIPGQTVKSLLSADSMGRYFNSSIKGRYDCRVNRVPAYK